MWHWKFLNINILGSTKQKIIKIVSVFSSVFFVYINLLYLHPLEYVENVYDHMIYIIYLYCYKYLKHF